MHKETAATFSPVFGREYIVSCEALMNIFAGLAVDVFAVLTVVKAGTVAAYHSVIRVDDACLTIHHFLPSCHVALETIKAASYIMFIFSTSNVIWN